MSVRAARRPDADTVIACNGGGAIPCKEAIPVPFAEWERTFERATMLGWTREESADGVAHDYCPSCSQARRREDVSAS